LGIIKKKIIKVGGGLRWDFQGVSIEIEFFFIFCVLDQFEMLLDHHSLGEKSKKKSVLFNKFIQA
jgi:hypothetical protein